VLLIAVYYRTNLTLRQVALLFGVSKSAAHRVVDHLAPLLALAPVTRRHGPDTALNVDGTLVPVHDRTITASSKNYRYSVHIQVVVEANTRLVVAAGRPVPGNRNDYTAYRDSGADRACRGAYVMSDSGYQGNRQVSSCPTGGPVTATDCPPGGMSPTPSTNGPVSVERAFAHMKRWNILRNCRRKRDGVHQATRVSPSYNNVTMAG
jgi:hypothetical protein